MPKMKTKKAAAKRFSYTGSGKIKSGRSGRRHLLTHMTKKRKRQLRGTEVLSRGDAQTVRAMMPYKLK